MKLVVKVGVTSLLLAVNAQFDSAFDQLNIVGDSSNSVEIPSYDPELVDAIDGSGDVDEAPVGFNIDVRKFNVPGWTDTNTHIRTQNGKKNKWKKSIKKNRKRIKAINSYQSSPFGMLAALRAATKKKIFNPSKISSKFVDYGCWCFQSEEITSFRLPSVDDYDEGCQSLVKCETCIKMDFAGNERCTNLENGYPEYNATITRDGSVECNNVEGSCERAYCECHKSFAESFPKRVSGDRQYSASRFDKPPKGKDNVDEPTRKDKTCVPQKKNRALSQTGRSDYEDQFRGLQLDGFFTTQSPSKGNRGEKAAKQDHCCGEYPQRFPFSSFDGDHGCCGGQTYDKQTKECCGNPHAGSIYNPFLKECCSKRSGNVKDFGTCP